MDTNDNTYPSWIKYFLGITAWLGLIKAFVTLLTDLTLYGAQVAIPDFIGSILLFIGVMLIISRKFWGYIFYCIIIISQYPLSYYMYGSVNDIVYAAIFVRLIVMSILVFVPFKRGHSLFNAMKPIFNPLKFFKSNNRISNIRPNVDTDSETTVSENLLTNNTEIIQPDAVGLLSEPIEEIETIPDSKVENPISKVSQKRNYRFIHILSSINTIRYLLGLIAIVSVTLISIFLFKSCSTSDNSAYYIDDNDMLHYSSHCNSIEGSLELLTSESLYEIATGPNNVSSPNYNFHFCGKCFDIHKIEVFKDSVRTHIFNTWGTTDADSLSILSKDITWFLSKSGLKYNWNNPPECLRFFKNPNNALEYYIKECNSLNLGTPREYASLLAPIFSSTISDAELTALANKKFVYDFLVDNNYDMSPFNLYLEQIEQPQRRERLYKALVSENAFYVIPLESYNDFQTWLGF